MASDVPLQDRRPDGRVRAVRVILWGAFAGAVAVTVDSGAVDAPLFLWVTLAAAVSLFGLGRWAMGRSGPRNLLRPAFLVWALVLGVLAVDAVLGLRGGVRVTAAGLFGGLAGWAVAAESRLFGVWSARRRELAWPLGALVVAPPLSLLLVWMLGLALVFTTWAVAVLVAWVLLGKVRDPYQPQDPLRPYGAWGDGSGRPRREGARRLVAAPANGVYLMVSWALFLAVAEVRRGILQAPQAWVDRWGYRIPLLTEDPLVLARVLLSGPVVNHDVVQLVYVSLLLVLFGVAFEAREGTRRFLVLFVGLGAVAALIAGALLHLVYPDVSTRPVFGKAWAATWTGGSAGAFAILGGVAARAPRPWLLFAAFALWEFQVGWWFLRSYTPAFHLSALVLGFLVTRHVLAPIHADPSGAPDDSG